jgi:hypothetical protein
MPALNVNELVTRMATAASGVLKEKWPGIESYARTEFAKLGQTVQLIVEERAKNQITQDEAALLLDMQRNAMRTVLLTSEGLGALAVEGAINAALGAAREIVNGAIGWALL